MNQTQRGSSVESGTGRVRYKQGEAARAGQGCKIRHRRFRCGGENDIRMAPEQAT